MYLGLENLNSHELRNYLRTTNQLDSEEILTMSIRTLKQVQTAYLTPEQAKPFAPIFSIGDKVVFTNDYGVVFAGKKVVGIEKPWGGPHGDRPRYYFAPHDAYWFPVEEGSLSLA